MKKLLLLVMAVALIAACGPSAEEKRLMAENDSLKNVGNNNQAAINDFMKAFNEIEDNLKTIKEKEQIIRVETAEQGLETSAKDRINEDILSLYKQMVDNKKALNNLTSKLKKSNVEIAQFKKLISNLETQLDERNNEILELRDKLENMNYDIANLNKEIQNLNADLDEAASDAAKKGELIEKQTESLNTAYYVVGTQKSLQEKGILSKSGLFSGSAKLTADFDKTHFTKVDITQLNNVDLGFKKVKFITTHPASSYELVGTAPIEKISIKNAKEFWSLSKVLVVIAD
ncbi:MAG TPA: hypothetical protein DCQ31_05490 [Bacteroidales bacterium]|nr:hypothetical protein [Bacteroidales bacterium]